MRRHVALILLSLALFISCSAPLVKQLESGDSRIKVTQVVPEIKEVKRKSQGIYTAETEKKLKQGYTSYDKDRKTGEDIMSVSLNEVQVVSRSKNIAERAGKVSLDFKVEVPSTLINNKWQVRLTPFADKNGMRIEFDKIFISGADFLRKQKAGYQMYQNFINSIIPDSVYMQMLFDTKGYQRALNDIEEMFYLAWKKELLSQDRFVDWKNIRNKRILLFNGIMERNKSSINPDDWKKILPSYHLQRNLSSVPAEWDMYMNATYSIAPSRLTSNDSIEISKKYFDYKRMAENERKKMLVKEKYNEYVIFPEEPCKLDTIIQKGDKFEYYYKQTINIDENVKKILLTVDGEVLALDESHYTLPKSDTITYYISSMVQFLDHAPRYKRVIVSRHAQANTTAYITFPAGTSKFIATDGNKKEISKVLETLHKLTFTGELVLDSVNMTATSSPEGSSVINQRLSEQRSYSLKHYLLGKVENADDIKLFRPRAIGEDWNGLSSLIAADSMLTNKSSLQDIITHTSNLDNREMKLRSFPEYAYIRNSLYPLLRAVKFDFFLHRREMVKDTIHTTVIDTAYMDAIKMMENRQYKSALSVLTDYNDYNTAVCLMSLGYDNLAIEILESLKQDENTYYLLAILYVRQKDNEKALASFKKSYELDSSKFYRGTLDPEINQLIINNKLNLNE